MAFRAGFSIALMTALVSGHVALAQGSTPVIVVIDQERLFEESVLGLQVARQLEERSAELAVENRAIEAELIAEERDLTERRSELDPVEFRTLADAFDEKVDRLRSEQDAKTRELVAIRDAGQQNFSQSVGPILLDYMRRSGASVMVDRRSVVAATDRVDVTDELIAEIDAQFGANPTEDDATGAENGALAPDPGAEEPPAPADAPTPPTEPAPEPPAAEALPVE